MKDSLVTARLRLRRWQKSDLGPFAAMSADPDVMEFFEKCLTIDETKSFMNKLDAAIEERGFGFWACELKDTKTFIGTIGIGRVDYETPYSTAAAPAVEVGWRLAQPFWGKGFAAEGARAAMAYGFENLGLEQIVAVTSRENQRSRRVMEKLGMTYDPQADFDHPLVAEEHWLKPHVLYRMNKNQFIAVP